MRIKASAGRDRKADLRETCVRLELRAENSEEAALLAKLLDQIIDHGHGVLAKVLPARRQVRR